MSREDLIAFLKENLSIEADLCGYGYEDDSYTREVTVRLILNNETISSSSFSFTTKD